MSQNPYEHNPYAQTQPMGDGGADADVDAYQEPKGTSITAIFSLVLGVLCCTGPLAVPLAIIALFRTGHGKKGGRVLAIIGLILGLIGSALWVGFFVSAQSSIRQQMKYGEFFAALEQDDWATARGFMSPDLSAATSDEELAEFAAATDSEFGTVVSVPDSFGAYLRSQSDPVAGPLAQELMMASGGFNLTRMPQVQIYEFTSGAAAVGFVVTPSVQSAAGVPSLAEVRITDGTTTVSLAEVAGYEFGVGGGADEGAGASEVESELDGAAPAGEVAPEGDGTGAVNGDGTGG